MRFKMNLQLFSEENTMDFGDADTGTEVAEELTAEQGDDFLSGLDEADAADEDEAEAEESEDDDEADQPEAEESTQEQGEAQDKTEDTQLFKVKHLGQEIELTMEQMIENAQKGLDYDRIRQDRDTLKSSRKIQLLEDLAKDSGYDDVDAFVENFYENLEESRVIERAEEIAAKRGIDFETAAELAKAERENEKLKKTMQEAEKVKAKSADQQKQATSEFQALFAKFPEIKEQYTSFDKLPESFRQKVAQGEQPLLAWNNYLLELKDMELKQKEKELEIVKNNQKNKKRSVGSAKGAGQAKETDDFLKGLFG